MNSYLDQYRGKQNHDKQRREEFGRKMVALRKSMCLSVEQMAAQLFISPEALRRIENGKVCPNMEEYAPALKKRIERLAELKGLSIA
ncbi:helix-turn-helix domain-containing protein [Thermaerobacillus caldiproteolyticus]|uniref:helix-turn-helix domain-containing protein n=1 Tax=Thermaerobacillus caldiproteolyticus TaxID=247480 RepID=UPI00188C0A94|nr:helix-turn-helix transcriptional regulator [Anoxybacillus caldiproteolyticus]QPA33402.1 helix-turn-helix transcriptional regulator [Anoxybacillus caldiproteolyticus]